MGSLAVLDRDQIESCITPHVARLAIGAALRRGPTALLGRSSFRFAGGELLVMPAEGARFAGVKIITLAERKAAGRPAVQGAYLLLDAGSLQPLALLDGPALTELRTAAVSAWVLDLLGAPRPGRLVLFGSGPQALAHLRAIAAVRELSSLSLVTRSGVGAATVLELAHSLGIPATAGAPDDVAGAAVVCCCTSSGHPLFDGGRLSPGTLVLAVGSHLPDRRELDTATVARSRIVVETRDGALESGDLLLPIAEGAIAATDIEADLFELAARGDLPAHPDRHGSARHGAHGVRPARDLTLFKSVGAGFEDLAVAGAVMDALGV